MVNDVRNPSKISRADEAARHSRKIFVHAVVIAAVPRLRFSGREKDQTSQTSPDCHYGATTVVNSHQIPPPARNRQILNAARREQT